jgi:peroxiredoxin
MVIAPCHSSFKGEKTVINNFLTTVPNSFKPTCIKANLWNILEHDASDALQCSFTG